MNLRLNAYDKDFFYFYYFCGKIRDILNWRNVPNFPNLKKAF